LPKAILEESAYEVDLSALGAAAEVPCVFKDESDVDPMPVTGDETAMDVARACRRAALLFMNGVASGWSKRDLAGWLLGPYKEATRHSAWDRMWPPMDPTPDMTSALRISELMELVRIAIAAMLADAPLRRATFVTDAIRSRAIQPARSQAGVLWIPVDAPRMGLERRVLALFAVDCLARPEDYSNHLNVCHHCDRVRFENTACDGCHGVHESIVRARDFWSIEKVG
jgi:hypothetical protein